MNLSDYLRQALQADDTQHIPDRRRYRTPMWGFTRRAKAHVDLAKLNGVDAFSAVDGCFRSWSDFPQVSDIWEDLFPDSDDPREEFIYTWERIKWSRNELDRAQADAALLPLKPTLCFSPGYGQFISVAGHLQAGVDGPILLPCAKLAEMLHCTAMAVSRYRVWAQESGLLTRVSKGNKALRKADQFSFSTDKFDWKTGNQVPSEDLNICLTSSSKCYPEVQENERNKEIQEKEEKKAIQEIDRNSRALSTRRKTVVRQVPYTPTTAELSEELRKTAHLRRMS